MKHRYSIVVTVSIILLYVLLFREIVVVSIISLYFLLYRELVKPERNTMVVSMKDVEQFNPTLASLISEDYYRFVNG